MPVETFDSKGDPIKGSKTIEIIQHAGENSGVRFEGKDLLPSNGPHKVPTWFALELIGGNRAVEYDPDNPRYVKPRSKDKPADKGTGTVVNNDPAAQNGDPKASGPKK